MRGGDGDAQEWKQCVELLKAMLQMDSRKRITPSEVFRHPFIGQSYLCEALQSGELSASQARTDFRGTETETEYSYFN